MDLRSQVTPLLITYNEEDNLRRTLAGVSWARDIVIVDSGSTDATLELVRECPQARVFHHPFESFARQCEFGLRDTRIETDWVLSLDADHVVTEALRLELEYADPEGADGFLIPFTYCVLGKPLRGSLYPARPALFRRSAGAFHDDGHGHRIDVAGVVRPVRSSMLHDDRKSLSRWLEAQDRYMQQEARKLNDTPGEQLDFADRIRKALVIAPFLAPLYCLIVKGCALDGTAGWHYAAQRMAAEVILSLRLAEARITAGGSR